MANLRKTNGVKYCKKELIRTLITVIAAMLLAFGLHIFVYPKSFALACFDDIAIILQKLTHVNAGIIEKTIYLIIKDTRSAVEFKIIKHNLNEIKHDMIYVLKHVQS